jgi:hypothetical protein
MKQLILSIVFVLAASSVVAQQQPKTFRTQQPCNTFNEIIRTVQEYGEELLFTGTGMTIGESGQPFTGGAFFFVNQDSGTWSLVSVYADGMACIVSNGTDFEPYTGPRRE